MAYIEGFGDEVVLLFGVALVALIIFLVWLSTSVNEQLHRHVIEIDRHRFRRLIMRFSAHSRRRVGIAGRPHQAQPVPTETPTELTAETQPSPDTDTQPAGQESRQAGATPGEAGPGSHTAPQTEQVDHRTAEAHSHTEAAQSQGDCDSAPSSPADPPTEEAKEGELDKIRQLRMSFLERQARASSADPVSNVDINNLNINSESHVSSSSPPQSSHAAETLQSSEVLNSVENAGSSGGGQQNPPASSESTPEPSSQSQDSPETTTEEGPGEFEPLDGHIRVKISYMDSRQSVVQARPEHTLAEFKRRHFASELAENIRVRLIYRGQELLNENESLRSFRLEDNCVLHCLLSRATAQQQNAPPRQPDNSPALDIGHLVFPLFGFMLILVWYCRFEYRQYFNVMSTLSMIGITTLYFIALLASRMGRRDVHPHQD